MEYVEGDALSRTLARVGRLTPARTMALVAQAADALHAAHEMGVVHRDVKPGNLLVRPNGTLVLTDFGIARSIGSAQLTAAGSVLGTASYISPEQAMGEQATRLSDVYALGVVAYQCLAGRRPFEGENPLEIAMRHVRETPPPLPPDIPPQVRAIVERAMAKDPGARWATAAAFAQVARRAAGDLAAAAPTRPGAAPATAMPQRQGVGVQTSTPTPTPVSAQVRVGTAPGGYARPLTPLPGYLQVPVPPPQRSSTGLIVALIVAVVLVAICVGAAVAIWQQAQDNNTLSMVAAVSIDQAEFEAAVEAATAGKGEARQ
jgi:serine/threonine-protein kinase